MQDERQTMLTEYSATRDPALRNALAEKYLYLARAVAVRFAGRGADVEDLTQVASIALLKAIERFDPSLGLAFTTYAAPTLSGEVRNYLRDKARTVRLPRRGSELLPRIQREKDEFFKLEGREPTVEELAERMSLRQDDVLGALEMARDAQPVSFSVPMTEDGQTLESLLGDEEAAFDRVDTIDQVRSLLSKLPQPSRVVLEERYFKQLSQREVANRLGVSQMQVSRLERRALETLRNFVS